MSKSRNLMDNEHLIEIGNNLRTEMRKKFPHYGNTIVIHIWEDNDYRVECRCGTGERVHTLTYHHSLGTTVWDEEVMLSNAIKVDAQGNTYYIPDELIPYLNKNRGL